MEYRILKNFPDMHKLERNIYISKTEEKQAKAQKPKAEALNTARPPDGAELSTTECFN
jgi:hypothetical protein